MTCQVAVISNLKPKCLSRLFNGKRTGRCDVHSEPIQRPPTWLYIWTICLARPWYTQLVSAVWRASIGSPPTHLWSGSPSQPYRTNWDILGFWNTPSPTTLRVSRESHRETVLKSSKRSSKRQTNLLSSKTRHCLFSSMPNWLSGIYVQYALHYPSSKLGSCHIQSLKITSILYSVRLLCWLDSVPLAFRNLVAKMLIQIEDPY